MYVCMYVYDLMIDVLTKYVHTWVWVWVWVWVMQCSAVQLHTQKQPSKGINPSKSLKQKKKINKAQKQGGTKNKTKK